MLQTQQCEDAAAITSGTSFRSSDTNDQQERCQEKDDTQNLEPRVVEGSDADVQDVSSNIPKMHSEKKESYNCTARADVSVTITTVVPAIATHFSTTGILFEFSVPTFSAT
jgi:hypothetical protein